MVKDWSWCWDPFTRLRSEASTYRPGGGQQAFRLCGVTSKVIVRFFSDAFLDRAPSSSIVTTLARLDDGFLKLNCPMTSVRPFQARSRCADCRT